MALGQAVRKLKSVMDKRSHGQKPLSELQGYGVNIPPVNTAGMQNAITSGTTMTGQKIPEWKPQNPFQFSAPSYNPMQFSTPNLQPASNQAYQGAMNNVIDNTSLMSQRLGNQAINNAAVTGRRGGLAAGTMTGINRDLQQTAAGQMRDIGLQKAMSDVDVAKTQGGWDMARQDAQAAENKFNPQMDVWRQQQQSAENAGNSQMGLQAQQTLQGLQQGQIGMMGTLQNQAAQEAMRPYQMLMQLYGANTGISPGAGGSGKGDPFSALLGAGAQIAPMFCLPYGTMIETEDGAVPVESIEPGDIVKGGRVLVTTRRSRPDGHKFYLHEFETGSVVMSDGHPYFDILMNKTPVESGSPCTYDILTTDGYYIVGGVKLGSTLK